MTTGPAHSIFCCTSAGPVLAERAHKIHNDPNRDYHDAICKSFMKYAIRKHREAILYEIMSGIEHLEVRDEHSVKVQHPLPPPSTTRTTPIKLPSTISPLTPPFTPAKKNIKGEIKEVSGSFDLPYRPPSFNDHAKTLAKEDEPLLNLLQHIAAASNRGPSKPRYLPSASKKTSESFNVPRHLVAYDGYTAGSDERFLADLLDQNAASASSRRARTLTLPSRSFGPSGRYDDSRLRSSSSVNATWTASNITGHPVHNAHFLVDTKTHHGPKSATSTYNGSVVKIHDHVMVIPPMPAPGHPTDELLYNPMTTTTEYIMHLTSRHDFGPVYSHRYFVCPDNLDDDWTELTLLQWFARGEPFHFKAEKWDIKCENDKRFFRMTLRPNLTLRTVDGKPI